MFDTLIICTITGLVVLMTGVWQHNDAHKDNVRESLTARAFEDTFGAFGGGLIAVALIFSVFSAVTVVIFYAARQAELLFGPWAGTVVSIVCITSCII